MIQTIYLETIAGKKKSETPTSKTSALTKPRTDNLYYVTAVTTEECREATLVNDYDGLNVDSTSEKVTWNGAVHCSALGSIRFHSSVLNKTIYVVIIIYSV